MVLDQGFSNRCCPCHTDLERVLLGGMTKYLMGMMNSYRPLISKRFVKVSS